MGEIRLTLETLYDILRNEKKKEDLQRLTPSFFFDVFAYLQEKTKLLKEKKGREDLFYLNEREKLEYELRSIKRILKEIYEKREKKIIDIALNKSRTKSDLIDTSAMLFEEKEFYEQLVKLLDGYREGLLFNLFKGEPPFFKKPEIKILQKEEKNLREEKRKEEEEIKNKEKNKENKKEKEVKERKEEEKKEEKIFSENPFKKIRFLHPVPSFVWKDLKEYGPFEAGEKTEIWPEVAELLIKKGRAEELIEENK